MWAFLVLVSGGFFYTAGAIMNAKATPNPTVVRYQAQAESMFVWHNIAKKESQRPANNARNTFYFSDFPSYGFTDSTWASQKDGSCLVTYSVVGSLTTERARSVTASLAKYATNGRSVGFIDANRKVTASSNPVQDMGKTLLRNVPNAKETPYIRECS